MQSYFSNGHMGIQDDLVKIIYKDDENNPTNKEGFGAYKLN